MSYWRDPAYAITLWKDEGKWKGWVEFAGRRFACKPADRKFEAFGPALKGIYDWRKKLLANSDRYQRRLMRMLRAMEKFEKKQFEDWIIRE